MTAYLVSDRTVSDSILKVTFLFSLESGVRKLWNKNLPRGTWRYLGSGFVITL